GLASVPAAVCRPPPRTGGWGLVWLPPGRTEELMPTLTALLPALRHDPGLAELVEAVPARGALDIAASVGVRPAVLAELATRGNRPLVVVTATGREAEERAEALRGYLPADDVATFPAWETLPHERLSPRSDTVARRIAVLRRLAHAHGDGEQGAASVTRHIREPTLPVRALLQPVVAGLELGRAHV